MVQWFFYWYCKNCCSPAVVPVYRPAALAPTLADHSAECIRRTGLWTLSKSLRNWEIMNNFLKEQNIAVRLHCSLYKGVKLVHVLLHRPSCYPFSCSLYKGLRLVHVLLHCPRCYPFPCPCQQPSPSNFHPPLSFLHPSTQSSHLSRSLPFLWPGCFIASPFLGWQPSSICTKCPAHIIQLLTILSVGLNCIPISSLRSLIRLLSVISAPGILWTQLFSQTCSFCQCHCLKTTQACQRYTHSVSATFSRPHRHAGVTHVLSMPLSQDHTGMPALHTFCQCHLLKTTQACRRYTRSVSATFSRPHRHAGVTHVLSVPPSQDHTGMQALHTFCQCHLLKTTQACRRYTRSVSATFSRPHRHAGVTHVLSVPPSQDHTGMPALHTLCQCHLLKTTQACRRYTRSVSATFSRPHRHAGVTHVLSVPPSQDHTGMPVLHTFCQCHLLKTTQACRRYTRSVSATFSRPHRHAGVTHVLSVPPSQDHTGMLALHTFCQCHILKTTQACRHYTSSVSATISRPHRHAGITQALSVPPSQDHTGMPALHTFCQCHLLKTTQACRRYTRSVSATFSRPHRHAGVTHVLSVPHSQDHTGMPALHTFCQCHLLKTTQACSRYTRSVSATFSRPHRHAGITQALSVPPSQDHTGMLALHKLCQCHHLKTTQACCHYTCSVSATVSRTCIQAWQCYTHSASATVSRPHRHAGVTHALSVPPSQDHTGMLALHTLCQCHHLKTTQACQHYTCSVSATVSRPYTCAGVGLTFLQHQIVSTWCICAWVYLETWALLVIEYTHIYLYIIICTNVCA